MYPPPEQAALKRLCGSILDSIAISRYQMMLRFENGDELVVRVPFCFGAQDKVQTQEWIDFPLADCPVVRALGASVADAWSDEHNNLWLEFSSGEALVVAWASMYESYELTLGSDYFLV